MALWLDAWLIGSLVMLGSYAKLHGSAFVPHWLQEWVQHPFGSTWAILWAQAPANSEMRKLWFLAQVPLGCLTGYLAYIRQHSDRSSPKEAAAYGSHGTAELDDDQALSRRFAEDGAGLILGQLPTTKTGQPPRWLIHPSEHKLNQFVLLVGSAGSFKSSCYIITNTLHETQASLVVADPKGEIYRETAAVKEAQGYRVRVINYVDMHLSARQNPLTYVRRPEDAVTAANVIIHNTENPQRASAGDGFFDMAEQALLTALILYVRRHCPPQEQNLGSVLALGTEPSQEELNAIFDALPREDPARRYYRTFRQAEDKTRACILLGFANRLQLWNLQTVEALTAPTDFDLADLGRERTCLYVIFPLGAKAKPLFPLMSLLWTQLCDELIDLANHQPTGQLTVPVRFRIDEAANIGHIPGLDLRVSTTRGLGLWWELAFQTMPQFKAKYHTWGAIAGCCDSWLYFGSNDLETQKDISLRLGRTTIQVQSANESHSEGGRASEGHGKSYTGRDLMTPDELARLEDTRAVLMQRGRNPAIVTKAFYRGHSQAAQIIQRYAHDLAAPPPVDYQVLNPQELPPVRALTEANALAKPALGKKKQTEMAHAPVEGASDTPKPESPLAFLRKQT